MQDKNDFYKKNYKKNIKKLHKLNNMPPSKKAINLLSYEIP